MLENILLRNKEIFINVVLSILVFKNKKCLYELTTRYTPLYLESTSSLFHEVCGAERSVASRVLARARASTNYMILETDEFRTFRSHRATVKC